MKQVYLANCLGFSKLLFPATEAVRGALVQAGWSVFEPFSGCTVEGNEINELVIEEKDPRQLISKLRLLNTTIASKNQRMIDASDIVIAILDGSLDIDAGVAAEIGYAHGRGKRVFALRTDFRLAADNAGSSINLQVEHFIYKSGGKIAGSVDELIRAMNGDASR